MSNARIVPYFCPYCAEEDLRPWESDDETSADEKPAENQSPSRPGAVRGAWHCTSCTRVFTVAFQGMVIPSDVSYHP